MDIAFAITRSTLALIGILFNSSVIYITIKAKWLHTPCNILLAFYEFCLLSFDINKLFELKRLFDWKYSMIQCFYISSIFLALFSISFILMAAIAIDRFISVFWPLRYQHLNRKIYFFLVALATFIPAIILLCFAYQEAADAPITFKLTNCGITSTLQKNAKYLMGLAISCELLSIIIYAILWITMRFLISENVLPTKRIFVSLLCILLVSLFGFTPNTSYYLTAHFLQISKFWESNNIIEVTVILALISCSANTIILFKFSGEYRRAFLRFIPILRYFVKNNEFSPPKLNIINGILPARAIPGAIGGGVTPSPRPGTTQILPPIENAQRDYFQKRFSHPQYTSVAGRGVGYDARRSTDLATFGAGGGSGASPNGGFGGSSAAGLLGGSNGGFGGGGGSGGDPASSAFASMLNPLSMFGGMGGFGGNSGGGFGGNGGAGGLFEMMKMLFKMMMGGGGMGGGFGGIGNGISSLFGGQPTANNGGNFGYGGYSGGGINNNPFQQQQQQPGTGSGFGSQFGVAAPSSQYGGVGGYGAAAPGSYGPPQQNGIGNGYGGGGYGGAPQQG